jgi:hypothetical protein
MTGITWPSVARTVERSVRYAIVGVFGVGLRRRNWGAVVNAVLALVATSLPDALERQYGVEFRPWQRLYASVSMLTHAVGMLGPYDEEGWWDHVTHTLSATLFGGFVYAAAHRRDRYPRLRVLAAIGCGGVVWELLEYAIHAISDRLGVESVLVPYSARDTALDLVFNFLGALLVLAFGDRFLRNFTHRGD